MPHTAFAAAARAAISDEELRKAYHKWRSDNNLPAVRGLDEVSHKRVALGGHSFEDWYANKQWIAQDERIAAQDARKTQLTHAPSTEAAKELRDWIAKLEAEEAQGAPAQPAQAAQADSPPVAQADSPPVAAFANAVVQAIEQQYVDLRLERGRLHKTMEDLGTQIAKARGPRQKSLLQSLQRQQAETEKRLKAIKTQIDIFNQGGAGIPDRDSEQWLMSAKRQLAQHQLPMVWDGTNPPRLPQVEAQMDQGNYVSASMPGPAALSTNETELGRLLNNKDARKSVLYERALKRLRQEGKTLKSKLVTAMGIQDKAERERTMVQLRERLAKVKAHIKEKNAQKLQLRAGLPAKARLEPKDRPTVSASPGIQITEPTASAEPPAPAQAAPAQAAQPAVTPGYDVWQGTFDLPTIVSKVPDVEPVFNMGARQLQGAFGGIAF